MICSLIKLFKKVEKKLELWGSAGHEASSLSAFSWYDKNPLFNSQGFFIMNEG